MGATECLDVYNNETAHGTPVALYPCNGGANQKWTVRATGGWSVNSPVRVWT